MEDDTYGRLLARLRELKTVAVGFSGGTDSSLLLAAAIEALGDHVLALTAVTPYMERQEVADALAFSSRLGVRHELVEVDMPEGIDTNPPERCYICKHTLFSKLLHVAREAGFERLVEGSNLDDLGDYRPGLRALQELDILSPLLACKISKKDVRRMSESLGLATWDKPTNACLLTRLPIGQRVTMEDLHRIEEAERFLKTMGYVCVRVRMHDDLARIEVPPGQRMKLVEDAVAVTRSLQELGFRYVTLDLLGYRLGSMNPEFLSGDRCAARKAPGPDEGSSSDTEAEKGTVVGSPA